MEQTLEETANVLFAFFLEGQAIQPFLDRHDPDLGEAVASPLRQDVAVEPRPIEGARGEAGAVGQYFGLITVSDRLHRGGSGFRVIPVGVDPPALGSLPGE